MFEPRWKILSSLSSAAPSSLTLFDTLPFDDIALIESSFSSLSFPLKVSYLPPLASILSALTFLGSATKLKSTSLSPGSEGVCIFCTTGSYGQQAFLSGIHIPLPATVDFNHFSQQPPTLEQITHDTGQAMGLQARFLPCLALEIISGSYSGW